ncbi:MAG: tetratricopeptide repeat protein, partial [Phycisphaerales bacterium]
MSLSRRARKQLIALGVIVALVAVVGFGGNQLRLARNAASAERAYKLGTEAFERGDYQETLTQLNRYLPSNQDDADALYMHAKARLEVPQDGGAHYTTALNWARRAADGDPDSVAKRLLILEIRVRSGRSSLPELLATVDSVLSLDPTRSDLRIFKADILRASDRQTEALRELRSIVSRDPSSIDALDRITRLLTDQPAEYSQWINTLDQQAADNPQAAAFDIARINARLRLIPANPRETGVSAIAATRALTAYEILTESLLEKTVQTPGQFRAALSIVDEVERAIRLTRPLTQRDAQATQDRLEDISTRAVRFADRHTGFGSDSGEHRPAFVLAATEWFWTSDRVSDLSRIASDWRRVSADQPTDAVPLAIESLITMTGALPDDQLVPMPETSPAPAGRLWIELASAARNLRQGELVSAAEALARANDQATIVQGAHLFAPVASADRDINLLVATTATPALLILEAETAAAAGDTARAMSLWFDAARQRRVWDRPALQLLETYRLRGNIAEAEQMSSEAMLRGAT